MRSKRAKNVRLKWSTCGVATRIGNGKRLRFGMHRSNWIDLLTP